MTPPRILRLLLIGVLGVIPAMAGASAVATAASAPTCTGVITQAQVAPPAGSTEVINAEMTVTNDEDSGFVGYWALDNYTKHIQVWANAAGTSFYVAVLYHGTWQTFAGAGSPANGTFEPSDGTGSITGGYLATLSGSMLASPTAPTHGTVGTYDFGGTVSDVLLKSYASGQTGDAGPVVDELSFYFPASTVATFAYANNGTAWGWQYTGNSTAGPWCNTGTGSSGDIITH